MQRKNRKLYEKISTDLFPSGFYVGKYAKKLEFKAACTVVR